MKAKVLFIFLITLFLFLLAGCQKQVSVFRPLTASELAKFVSEQKVVPLVTSQIGNSLTVILYETENEMGQFLVSADEKGQVHPTKMTSNNNSAFTPVSISYTGGTTPFVTAIINDIKIQREAKKIKVVFDNGHQVIKDTQGKQGFIIADQTKAESNITVHSREVVILDQNGEILNDQKI